MFRNALIIFGVLVLLVGFPLIDFFVLDEVLPNVDRYSGMARLVQSYVTALVLAGGGIFALYKFQVFRDFEPHLDVRHEISHRHIGDSYVHIGVTAILHNGSKVKIEILKGIFALQKIEPISDDMIEELYARAYNQEMEWPVLEKVERIWSKNDLVIEPGESHRETYEFIISRDATSVLVYTYFDNSTYSSGSQKAEGWTATSFYDILP